MGYGMIISIQGINKLIALTCHKFWYHLRPLTQFKLIKTLKEEPPSLTNHWPSILDPIVEEEDTTPRVEDKEA